MTRQELVELEPRLHDLYEQALEIRAREESKPRFEEPEERVEAYLAGDYFCATQTWHNELKPQMRRLVGHGVGSSPGETDEEIFKRLERLSSDAYVPNPLATTEAYGIAYQKISSTLPRCRNCYDDAAVSSAIE